MASVKQKVRRFLGKYDWYIAFDIFHLFVMDGFVAFATYGSDDEVRKLVRALGAPIEKDAHDAYDRLKEMAKNHQIVKGEGVTPAAAITSAEHQVRKMVEKNMEKITRS